MSDPRKAPLTVTEITRQIKNTLEGTFPFVSVEGELSNVRPSAAGHLYFTLKDEQSALSAVMFRGRASSLAFAPEDGQQVIATGNISVYAKRGAYQIIVEQMKVSGVGRILATLEERKQRLAAEGLFDANRKRRLPLLPKRVAVVTSPTGAALRDIINVLGRRNAGIDLVVCPTPVQGDDAAARIAMMVRIASAHRLGDVIIVGRGGGSIEDLLPFSDEDVVRAVAESEVPVISAVGHEIDWALVDFAADQRAPTPSAAAEVVATARDQLQTRVLDLGHSIVAAFAGRVERARLIARQFTPAELHRSYEALAQPVLMQFDQFREDLLTGMTERSVRGRHALELATRELQACSPFDVLKRGYAIVRAPDGHVLTDASRSALDDLLSITLRKGALGAAVKEIHPHEKL